MSYRPLVVLCLPMADLHHFCLTKHFPKTHSAIQPIGTPSAFCIHQIVPGFVVYHLNYINTKSICLQPFVDGGLLLQYPIVWEQNNIFFIAPNDYSATKVYALRRDPNFIQYRIDLSKGVRAYGCTLVPAELLGNWLGY